MSYVSELHEGDVVETYSHMMELADKTILIEHRLFNAETGALSAVGRVRAISFSHKTRRACPWPETTRAAFEAYVNR
jgi:acyl-CoA thioesterase FadM